MKPFPFLLTFCLLLQWSGAESLRFAGVLGNSGEQGPTLVRFNGKLATGAGVVFDPSGSLFDRGGENSLNRYAIDGRQLASYPLPNNSSKQDRLVILGEDLILNIDKKLYSLPLASPAGTAPAPLPSAATTVSFNTHDGWAAATSGKEVFYINRHGEKRPLTTLAEDPNGIEIGPEGKVFASIKGKLHRIETDASTGQNNGPWESPGDNSQWLNGGWFGSAHHGTLRRFNTDFNPDPGVVLGGASGWFIGYVEGNHELNDGQGLAHLGGNLYAVSGNEGILHLLEWDPVNRRFTIIRRIGAVAECSALAIDAKGRVWHHTGVWDWSDGPDAPFHHSVPPPEEFHGLAMLDNGAMTGPAIRYNKPVFYHGDLTGPAGIDDDAPAFPKDAVATTLVQWNKRDALLISDPTGKGIAVFVDGNGKPQGKAADFQLQTSRPLADLTSLTTIGPDKIVGAAGHQLIEFSRSSDQWKESRRWNSWGEAPESKFGPEIHVTAHSGTLWISDTARHRVIAFDAATSTAKGIFGTTDQAGDDLTHLSSPKTIAANGQRAVFHDSGNQRLIKLEIAP